MVFPTVTHDNFEPVDPIDDNHGLYEYAWPGMAWAAGAGAQFRRDIVNWFRRVPPGRYRVLLRVLYNDGGQATVAHGTREVNGSRRTPPALSAAPTSKATRAWES